MTISRKSSESSALFSGDMVNWKDEDGEMDAKEEDGDNDEDAAKQSWWKSCVDG